MKANLTPDTARRVEEVRTPKETALRSRVFIIQYDETRDYFDATRFGRLIPLVHGAGFPDNTQDRVWATQRMLRAKLRDFNGHRDYLLLSGDPVWIALAVFIVSTLTNRIMLLKWDRQTRMYYPVSLTEQRAPIEEKGTT